MQPHSRVTSELVPHSPTAAHPHCWRGCSWRILLRPPPCTADEPLRCMRAHQPVMCALQRRYPTVRGSLRQGVATKPLDSLAVRMRGHLSDRGDEPLGAGEPPEAILHTTVTDGLRSWRGHLEGIPLIVRDQTQRGLGEDRACHDAVGVPTGPVVMRALIAAPHPPPSTSAHNQQRGT